TVNEIVASGFAYPSELVDNDTYLARCRFHVADDPAKLIAETKMRSRTWCRDDENTWTLARAAVDRALAKSPGLRDELDVVLVSSGTTMPIVHPPLADSPGMADLAPLVLRHLGRNDALGLDLKACYCTGFLRGLQVMDGLLENPNYRAGLVVSAEQGSRFAVAETNQSSFSFLAGDAAGAVLLRRRPKAEGVGLVDYLGYTDAAKLDWVGVGPDARSIVNKGTRAGEAVHQMFVECAHRLLDRNGLTMKDVRWLIPLQTHVRLVEGLRRAVECPPEKLLWFGDVVGLSGSASIPSCFAEQREKGVIKKGDLILAVAVGAGLNCAGALFHG
ncbi:MAG: 3-oxoacyl-[acyl-carrier-protein] synthase III C-terminal domain-containing protein, partial [Myxococcaceae bacterium]